MRFKDAKRSNPALILLNWLFQDEVLFQAVLTNLSKIIVRNEDRFLALGWCLLIRRLVECEDTGDQDFWNGEHYNHSCYYVFNIGSLFWGKEKAFHFLVLSSLDLSLCICILFFVDRNWGETFYLCGDCFILCASLVDDCTQRKV